MSRLATRHFAYAALALTCCADPEPSKPSAMTAASTVSEANAASSDAPPADLRDDEMPLGSADVDVVDVKPASTSTPAALPSWLPPVVGRISQHFGDREDGSLHDAIDIAVPVGTEVLAPCEMRISYVGYRTNAGRFLMADGEGKDGEGFEFTFAHLSHVDVTEGQHVGRGDVVALSGITGNVTGPHLHFRAERIEKNGRTAIDPLPFVGLGGDEDAQRSSAVAHAP
jgi:murein DD-endopeptidase MepM/ murein hydrolase activator NlpD